MAAWRGWTVAPVWQMRAGRMDGYGELPDWNTLDLNMSKAFSLPRTGPVVLKLTVKNIFDCRYETVSGYPMPGRNFMCGIDYRF
jgi:outer membrane cobalamin receptor